MLTTTTLNPQRAIAELQELHALTGDGNAPNAWLGRQRGRKRATGSKPSWPNCRSKPTRIKRAASGQPAKVIPTRRCSLAAISIRCPMAVGWMGCLNVVAGLEVLRRVAAGVSGLLQPAKAAELRDCDGLRLAHVVQSYGVDIQRAKEAGKELRNAAYLELHIEQGPGLESMNLPIGAVIGTYGVERHSLTFVGQAAHTGSTPMNQRRDALGAAAKFALEIREIAKQHGGACTCGRIAVKPNIPTAVVGECDITLAQRHLNIDAVHFVEIIRMASANGEMLIVVLFPFCVNKNFLYQESSASVNFFPILL